MSRSYLTSLLVCVFLCVSVSVWCVDGARPLKWRVHRMLQHGMHVSSPTGTEPIPTPTPTPAISPSLAMTCSMEHLSNTTILEALSCFPNTTMAQYLIQNWDALSSLRNLLNNTGTNTTNSTLFVPTDNAIQQSLYIGMRAFGIKLHVGSEQTQPSTSIPPTPPTDSLLKELPQQRHMKIKLKKAQEPPFQFPPASVYYNISYPFPPPSLPINITLTPQQLLLILTRLPVPLQHMFVASISYHIIPGRMVTRNNTCFMQAIETAMQGEHVEQVPGGQLVVIQNFRNGMNETEYLHYLQARHTVVQGKFNATIPPYDLRILAGNHATPYNVDPIAVDISTSNGIIHIVDQLIMVPPSIAGYLIMMNTTTSILSTAISRYHELYREMILPNSTLFIPTNYAFERYGLNPSLVTQQQWKQLISQHVVKGVHVMIPDIGNTSFCHPTPLPLNITTISHHPLMITQDIHANHTFMVNGTNMIDDNVIIMNGVVHLIDNLLISPQFLSELHNTIQPLPISPPTSIPIPPLIPPHNATSCPNASICVIYNNITTRDEHISVCYDPNMYVCVNGTYMCPMNYPLLCVGSSIDCYHPAAYACVPMEGTSQHHLIPLPQTPQQGPITPYPGPSPVATPPPQPIIPPGEGPTPNPNQPQPLPPPQGSQAQ